jgi:hypothetical protein
METSGRGASTKAPQGQIIVISHSGKGESLNGICEDFSLRASAPEDVSRSQRKSRSKSPLPAFPERDDPGPAEPSARPKHCTR